MTGMIFPISGEDLCGIYDFTINVRYYNCIMWKMLDLPMTLYGFIICRNVK